MRFQKNPTYIRDPSETNGWRFLCDSEAGGGQGNALTGPSFVMVIDEAMKSTDEKFGIIIRAIQDDLTLLGDAKVIFGTNGDDGALEFPCQHSRRSRSYQTVPSSRSSRWTITRGSGLHP